MLAASLPIWIGCGNHGLVETREDDAIMQDHYVSIMLCTICGTLMGVLVPRPTRSNKSISTREGGVLQVHATIPCFVILDYYLNGDNAGWFNSDDEYSPPS